MRRLISIIILCIGILTNADAQIFTQRIQKQVAGQGSITIRQDSVIDQLVNSATLGIKSSGQAAKPSQTSSTSPTSTSSPSSSILEACESRGNQELNQNEEKTDSLELETLSF